MNEHATDLGDFLSRDERGKTLPGYLKKLVAEIAGEKRSIGEELGSLPRVSTISRKSLPASRSIRRNESGRVRAGQD